MRMPYRALEAHDMQYKTADAKLYAEQRLQEVSDFESDARKAERERAGECRACYYLNGARWGGASMTAWSCGLCGDNNIHGSTNTPRVCKECSDKHIICAQCGGDREMRERRRKWPTATLMEPS